MRLLNATHVSEPCVTTATFSTSIFHILKRVEQHVVGPDSHKTRKLFEKAVCGHF